VEPRREREYDIIVLNMHAPTKDKSDETKHSFYDELEHVFDQYRKYHMEILLENFCAKVEREISNCQEYNVPTI
jgi:hypothetical protein